MSYDEDTIKSPLDPVNHRAAKGVNFTTFQVHPPPQKLTLKLEVRDEIGVGGDSINALPLAQVPHFHTVIITTRSQVIAARDTKKPS